MNKSTQLLALARLCQRQLARPASTVAVAEKSEKLRVLQKRLQIDDGVPVYLKKGFGDKMLYQGTLVVIAVGLGMSIETLYRLTFGKKD